MHYSTRFTPRLFFAWILPVALAFVFCSPARALEADHHALARFWFDTPADREFMDENHVRFQIEMQADAYLDLAVTPEQLEELLAAGSRVEVVHEDLESFYASRVQGGGVWGEYHTFSETIAFVDNLRSLYPSVVSARWSIGQGHDGNDIWCFRISDNPDVDENEPETLFDGLTHANEIMGTEVTLLLAEYLAEQYDAGNPEIVQLLNEREVYLIPVVNPDGMLYNEQVYPNGGATWRKNRRNNGGGSWGVDLNRNYDYEWGCDWGSSGDPNSTTYRGPSAASEPEIQALVAFINDREFVTRQSYHSAGNITLYPWGYTTDDTPDEDTFREIASAMTMFNGYRAGQPGDPGALYPVCGGAFDWDYGAQSEHEKIFGVTNELGTSQWPSESQIQPIFDDNLWPALYLIQMAGALRGVSWDHSPVPFTADAQQPYALVATPLGYEGAAIDTPSVALHFRVDGGLFTEVAMVPTGQPGEFGATIPAQSLGSVVEYYLFANDLSGNQGTSPREAPSALHYFEIGTEFSHAMEADRGWTHGDAGDDAVSGLWIRVDPIGTPAQPDEDHTAEGTDCWVTGQHVPGESTGYNDIDGGKTTLFSPVYDLTGASGVAIDYWRWYSNSEGSDPGTDWWVVSLSNDGGGSWVDLENSQASNNAWEPRNFELADYFADAGQVQVRFVASDEGSGSIVEAAVDDFDIAGEFETTSVDGTSLAVKVGLDQNSPNPFREETAIRFQHPMGGEVRLGVFDASGRLLRVLLSGPVDAGEYALRWNGTDALGRPVASGVYFARLETAGGKLSCRMVLAR